MATPPYTPAHLVNGDKPVTSRWYIVFWVWDAVQGKKVRKRCYKVNLKKTKLERLRYAKDRIAAINKYLEQGYHVNAKQRKKEQVAAAAARERDYTIYQAVQFILPVIRNSKRPATFNSYNSLCNLFLAFCEEAGWIHWKIRSLEKTDIVAFLDYIQSDRDDKKPVSNTTRNKYLSYLAAIFTMLMERGAMSNNPAHGIKLLRQDDPGNVAYTVEQVDTLKAAIAAADERLWIFVTFMLYGFIRPGEIARLQVNMIDLKARVIRLPGKITKNGYDRSVRISPHFAGYIERLDLGKYDGNAYVFGYGLQTCKKPLPRNYANAEHAKIARKLGFGSEYTLYSWKHTGVCLHYKAGIDIKTLQEQIGHRSLTETDIYLRSLGLYHNSEIEDKSPAI